MILVDYQIKGLCEQGLVTPYDETLVNPSSLDIRIGASALIDTPMGFVEYDMSIHSEEKPYYLQPNEFILVSTFENFKIPASICASIKLKSTRAREGLSHALAGHVDNGFHGVLTLELKNYSSKKTVGIYMGQKIGQMIFNQTPIPNTDYSSGRYSGFTKVIGAIA